MGSVTVNDIAFVGIVAGHGLVPRGYEVRDTLAFIQKNGISSETDGRKRESSHTINSVEMCWTGGQV